MKTKNAQIARIIFLIGLATIIIAYIVLFHGNAMKELQSNYNKNKNLEKEKQLIAEVMLDVPAAEGEVRNLKKKLNSMGISKQLNQASLVDDIAQNAEKLGAKIIAINLGEPEKVKEGNSDGYQLLSVNAEVLCTATYDGGMYLLAGFVNSANGAYEIDGFSFEKNQTDYPDEMDWNIKLTLLYYSAGK